MPQDYEPGDRVKVLDTANGRKRIAYVRSVDGNKIRVYMQRWDTFFEFDTKSKLTDKGRFKLLGRG